MMFSGERPAGSGPAKDKILIIGKARSDLITSSVGGHAAWECVVNPLEGIHAASVQTYRGIAVVTQGLVYRLRPIVAALQQNYEGRIVFLCQMVEEPLVRQFIQRRCDQQTAEFDYLICPTSVDRLASLFDSGVGQATSDASVPVQAVTRDQHIRRLEKLATEDDLTGLKNRRYVWEFGKQILDYARRETARVTLLVYDIDDFKHYNDRYGHSAGDMILKEAAALMRRCCRAHDVVGRLGGDEFVVFFWDDPLATKPQTKRERRSAQMEHPKEAIIVAQRFQAELEKSELSFLGPGGKGVLTISGGLATYPRDGETIERLFQRADDALLDAKRSGKNRIYLVGAPQSEEMESDAHVEA